MSEQFIISSNLEDTFRALRSRDPQKVEKMDVPANKGYKYIPNQNYAPTTSISSTFGGGSIMKTASANNGGIVYGQPQFFSPVHTPINWQIPSKRLEIYQWNFVPHTHILLNDFTYSELESTPFACSDIIEDKVTGGHLFEALDYPEIMNSEGGFNQPPRISVRDCTDKRCFSFEPLGNWRKVRVSEEHKLFVLDGKAHRKNKKLEKNKKYRLSKGIVPNGVTKVKIQDELIKSVEARDIKRCDYLLTPIPDVGTISLDKDLAWLIGYCVADGCIGDHSVWFTGCKGEVSLIKCEEILKDKFDSTISSKKHGDGSGWRVGVHTKESHDFFRKYIVSKGTSKKFSKEVFELDEETRLNILGGYFDGDGSLSKREGKIIANCYSMDLIDQIYWLLLSCNIVASLGKYPLYGDHYDTSSDCCYRIFVPSSQVTLIGSYMRGDKIPSDFKPKKERYLKFFYTEDGVKYLANPIDKIEEFKYSGPGYDIEMTNERHALVANGYISSNCRFFYENEPKVASAIDFYSSFPMNDYEHECKDGNVKKYFDKLKKRLELPKWLRLMSHEIHKLGDCFPFVEIYCERCGGAGWIGEEVCEHEGGTIKRVVILNPDYIEVYNTPLSPDAMIVMKPSEELINIVQRKMPGFEKLSPKVRGLIAAGRPFRLDNRNVSHLKYGEGGYTRYGTSMVKRLFPILAYKTKLMVAQWIVAERLIVPAKVIKVGSDERPAGPADIAAVQAQIAQASNDPNLTIVTHHAFDMDYVGANGKILTLSNEFEFINQEILDGMMINNALLNGEGPNFASAAVGIETMIQKLETFRREVASWIEEQIYLPEAIRQGFYEKDEETGEIEYIYPTVKWNPMHLRDQQTHRNFVIQLFDKGLLSAQTVLEAFGFDPDKEIERKRYDALQEMAAGGGEGGGGMGGEMGGGFGGMGGGGEEGGGLGDMLGGGEGGDMGGGGGEAPISAPPGGDMGAGPALASTTEIITTSQAAGQAAGGGDSADPSLYGGKILKKKTREKLDRERKKVYDASGKEIGDKEGFERDGKGRVVFTNLEMKMIDNLRQYQSQGLIKYKVVPQFEVAYGNRKYPLDFAIPALKIGLEADGEIFHSSPKQLQSDGERDRKLAQMGWTILRFKDSEIEDKMHQVMSTVLKAIMKKELYLKNSVQ